jgi:hypothetical protein
MASILRVNTLTDASSNNSTAMSTINQGTAKSWTNAEQIGTNSVRDSFNGSSITDNATGDLSVTVTSAMANINYAHVGTAGQGARSLINISQNFDVANPTTTVSRYQMAYVNDTLIDVASVCVALHGDLA